MKKRLFTSMMGIVLLAVFGIMTASAQTASSVVKFKVKVRNNVSVEIGATVISRTDGSNEASVLVLNGTSQTSNTFTALAQAVLASNSGVSRMILLDYPGRGNSGIPLSDVVKYGDLTIDDYVTVLINSLDKLGDLNLGPNALMGHSLGAQVIHMAQTRLTRNGETLRGKFGITAAFFLVPDIANPLPWAAIDAGAADPLAAIFVRNDPVLGNVFDLLTHPAGPPTFLGLFYANNAGAVVSGAPTPDQAVANGFIAIESAAMVSQLIGLPIINGMRQPRPAIDANIFAPSNGTKAGVVTLEQDGTLYAFPTEHRNVYRFITGDQSDKLFFIIRGPSTVHNVHTIRPGLYNRVFKKILKESADNNDYNEDEQ